MSAIQQNPLIQPDPLIDEIREIRRLVSERFGHDVHRLGEHLRQAQETHRDRLIPRQIRLVRREMEDLPI